MQTVEVMCENDENKYLKEIENKTLMFIYLVPIKLVKSNVLTPNDAFFKVPGHHSVSSLNPTVKTRPCMAQSETSRII